MDLHGLTLEVVKRELDSSLAQRNRRYVKIIHGIGLHSKQGRPTIRSRIGKWLKQRPEVQAFCPAKQIHGGAGALNVLLKKLFTVNNSPSAFDLLSLKNIAPIARSHTVER